MARKPSKVITEADALDIKKLLSFLDAPEKELLLSSSKGSVVLMGPALRAFLNTLELKANIADVLKLPAAK